MIFHSIRKNIDSLIPVIKIKNILIERVQSLNFLGVNLDEHLNWNSHIIKLLLKYPEVLVLICKLKHYLPIHIMRTLYYSLIFPICHMEYWPGGEIQHISLNSKKKPLELLLTVNIMIIQNLYLNH